MKDDINVELYLAFRSELDKMCVPVILGRENITVTDIMCEDEKAGIMCTQDEEYIDCIYVKPEYRQRGLASKTVLEYVKRREGKGIRLAILNNNIGALAFWNRLFVLWRIDGNDIDTLYEIVKIKPEVERLWMQKETKVGMILQSKEGTHDD